MRRVYVVCEGHTEVEIIKKPLYKYFVNKYIILTPVLITKTKGGITGWPSIKQQVEALLKSDGTSYVTTFIDYYGIMPKYNFPGWVEAQSEPNKIQRIDLLEKAMFQDINDKLSFRFFPYLQLHEIEGLLFIDIDVFKNEIPRDEIIDLMVIENTISANPNPELINDNRDTSPSHRLKNNIRGYSKIVYGEILFSAIGIERIRAKAVRFNSWLDKLEKI